MAKDTIRVYYPKNGENWIRWDRDCSVDVKVNLSRGTEYGFCRIGFSYSRDPSKLQRIFSRRHFRKSKESTAVS